MRSAAPFLAAWTAWLFVLAALLWILDDDPLPPALLSAAALGWGLIGVASALRPDEPPRRSFADSSLATVIVTTGLVATLLGAVFGLWLVLVGAEIVLLGAIWLYAESRELRRRRRT